jgi:hypothetical protein
MYPSIQSFGGTLIHWKTRRVENAGITANPNAVCVTQVCRSLTDCESGFLIWAALIANQCVERPQLQSVAKGSG